MKREIVAYIRFQEWYFKFDSTTAEEREKAIDDFLKLDGHIEFPDPEGSSTFVRIRRVKKTINKKSEKSIFDDVKEQDWFKISITVNLTHVSSIEIESFGGKKKVGVEVVEGSHARDLVFSSKVETFKDNICRLLLTLNIARMGVLRPLCVFVSVPSLQKKYHLGCTSSHFLETRGYIKEIGWPSLQDADFKNLWIWLNKLDGFKWKMSSSPAGRAVNALSYIFADENKEFPGNLFTALLGLEALYVENKNEISSQLSEKSQLVLGKMDNFKKMIKQMYNFRSKLIHGATDWKNRFDHCDGDDHKMNLIMQSYRSEMLATGMLVGSIQKLFLRDKNKFEFEYVLKE